METVNNVSSISEKFFLRFIFCYIILYIFPYGFEYVIWSDKQIDTDMLSFWTPIVPWFGKMVLGWNFDIQNLGKGLDTKYDFARFLLCAMLSLTIVIVWSFIDSKHKQEYDNRLRVLLKTILRYHVGLTMVLYGIAKVFLYQFGKVGVDRLEFTIGEFRPMTFLWTFMGYSEFYTIATGFLEVIGGLFLLFRATTFLGSIISLVCLLNVVLIDIGYDVIVKMFAIHLLLMTMLLLMDDFKRVMYFFVLNKPTQPAYYDPLFSNKRIRLFKYFLLIYFSVTVAMRCHTVLALRHDQRYASVSKLYKVEDFVINSDTLKPLQTDTVRWKSISISGGAFTIDDLVIKSMNDVIRRFTFKADTTKHTLIFHPAGDTPDPYRIIFVLSFPTILQS